MTPTNMIPKNIAMQLKDLLPKEGLLPFLKHERIEDAAAASAAASAGPVEDERIVSVSALEMFLNSRPRESMEYLRGLYENPPHTQLQTQPKTVEIWCPILGQVPYHNVLIRSLLDQASLD